MRISTCYCYCILYFYVSSVILYSIGLNEDFVTGSAQCALAPYYYNKLSIRTRRARLPNPDNSVAVTGRLPGENEVPEPVFLSGYQASKRGGSMQIALVDSAGEGHEPADRVLIKGKCVTIMKSRILV